jgi:Tol biopolymer transport system component
MDNISALNSALGSRYRIERKIGEGGMATVYLADDLRHERKVALKVLRPELAAVVGAERFLAEIKTTATLHHPNILPLFDSGEADGFLYFVMPYVEGETLRARIDREKQLSVVEAVRITTGIAAALQHAHDRDVVHRDIKPANILLQDGEPVVADFGIALAVGAAGGSRLTETGLSVGTPFYMSPEQATGDQAIGPYSDIYALAAVLYEMLVGDPPYVGSTAQAVLVQILAGEPVSAVTKRRSVPGNVDAAIRRALEQIPADRFADAQAFAKALADPAFRYGPAASTAVVPGGGWSRSTMAMGALAAVFAAAFFWVSLRPGPPPPVTRQILSTEGWEGLSGGIGRRAALAPDGSSMTLPIQVGGRRALAVKMRGSADIRPIPDTEDVLDVVYAPDGQRIAYAVPGELRARPLIGGSSVTLARDLETANRVSLDWLDDGTLLYERQGPNTRQIVRITDEGEELGVVWPAEGQFAPVWLRGLPGSTGALLIACEGLAVACEGVRSRVYAIDLDDLSAAIVLEQVVAVWYAPTGHMIYVRADGAIFAVPFDVRSLEITGSSVPLFEGVRLTSNAADMRLGADGTLLYVEGGGSAALRRRVVWVDRSGAVEPVAADLMAGDIRTPRLSPDDRRLAVTMEDQTGTARNVWVKELPNGAFTRITNPPGFAEVPFWSADGATIYYRSTEGPSAHLRAVRADGSTAGAFEILLRREANISNGASFTPDGRGIVFSESPEGTGRNDIMYLNLATDSARTLLVSEFNESYPTLSPDGRWLAYVSNETGPSQVFVRPFPSTESARWQVSTTDGREPVWAHNGRELFYRSASAAGEGPSMMAATYSTDDRFRVQSRARLFDASGYVTSPEYAYYDLTADDQRFVMVALSSTLPGDDEDGEPRLILVQNWFEELRELISGN